MSGSRFENDMIEHCAPTLAGLKSASLFRYYFKDKDKAGAEIEATGKKLIGCGVYVEIMRWDSDAALIYAYRLSRLKEEIKSPKVGKMLAYYGYPKDDVLLCIACLKGKLCNDACFPHEIGLFLGYPPEDVKGFIENKGENCKCCGAWKAYCNEKEKNRMFCKLKKCSEICRKVYTKSGDITQVTVCA
ncbi:MAG: DUF3793 family protein [Butyrivibrio sp.]